MEDKYKTKGNTHHISCCVEYGPIAKTLRCEPFERKTSRTCLWLICVRFLVQHIHCQPKICYFYNSVWWDPEPINTFFLEENNWHAITGGEVTMDKVHGCQISHSLTDLETKIQQLQNTQLLKIFLHFWKNLSLPSSVRRHMFWDHLRPYRARRPMECLRAKYRCPEGRERVGVRNAS